MSSTLGVAVVVLSTEIIQKICYHFQIGSVQVPPVEILGGKVNRVWHLSTALGEFALKQIFEVRTHQEAERIGMAFRALGMPSTRVRRVNHEMIYKTEHGDYFLLFDWLHAEKFKPHQVTIQQAQSIGALLGDMHNLQLSSSSFQVSALNNRFYDFSVDERELAAKAEAAILQAMPEALLLKQQLPLLVSVLQESLQSQQMLAEARILSHRDITPNNVLWSASHRPIMIDWELAGLIHPWVELVAAAFDWSICTPKRIAMDRFSAVLQGYREHRHCTSIGSLKGAFSVVMGTWLSWLFFNLNRYLETKLPAIRTLGIREVRHTLLTFSHVYPQRQYWLRQLEG